MRLNLRPATPAILIAGAAAAQTPNIKSIDLYGTSQITVEEVRRKFGAEIEQVVKSYRAEDYATAERVRKTVEDGIMRMGDFAMARLSIIFNYDKERSVYVTVDIVDSKDKATRMEFLPAPAGVYADPDGLFKLWREYEKAASDLMSRGELAFSDACPAIHCLFGFNHPQLSKYLEAFDAGAAKHRALLVEILHKSRDQYQRGHAAYLLAHTKDAAGLVAALLPSVRDSSSYVRNNVLRVLIYAVRNSKEARVPIGPVLKAIEFPETTDRNKSLYVLDGLADLPENRRVIINEAGATLIRILRLTQPNNHDPAYSILKKVSGRQYGERDYAAWEQWLKESTGR